MPTSAPETAEWVRERKRRETRQQIAATGLRLFLANGYEQTTLDAIAAEAGISRRTFFAYFNEKAKEEILFVWQYEGWNAVWEELRTVSPDEKPLDAVQAVLLRHVARHANDEMRALDRVMRASETLQERKQAAYAEHEQGLFATLCEVWRQPQRRPALRMVAMACVGVMRLSLEQWHRQEATNRTIAEVLQEGFDHLRAGIQ